MKMLIRNSTFKRLKQLGFCGRTPAVFWRSENGTMTILGLALMMVVFAVAGFAVDMMRYDHERARLQYSLDRAVLAAADLQQELCPKDVVQDYLVKEGLESFLNGDVVVEPKSCDDDGNKLIVGKRRVQASATMPVEMHFMKWWDVDTIDVNVLSVAEESIGNVEIAMILDVSGSMSRSSRLTNLKSAAKKFVTKMYENSSTEKLSISIVPYATQVGVPDSLMNELTTVGSNTNANCIDFTPSQLTGASFDTGATYNESLLFTRSGSDRRPSNLYVSQGYPERCRGQDSRKLVVHQNDETALHTYIDSFYANDNTSINIGMKWGLTMLDESFRPIVSKMITAGDVPAVFTGRPANSVGSDTMKVIVLMTDGHNTDRSWVNEPYNTGQTGIWWNDDAEIYSINVNKVDESDDTDGYKFVWPDVSMRYWDSSRERYWVRDEYQDHAYGNTDVDSDGDGQGIGEFLIYLCDNYSDGACQQRSTTEPPQLLSETGSAVSLSWKSLWEQTSRNAIEDILEDAIGSTLARSWRNRAVSTESRTTKDNQVKAMCDYAKDQKNIIIFSVAYEASYYGRQLLWHCKSNENSYFAPTGGEIGEVFDTIAASVQNLRLTQ